MPTLIPSALRNAVIERAQEKCEYCHKPQVRFYPHEVDHVIAVKHGGETKLENLAFACFQCDRYKGSDLHGVGAGIATEGSPGRPACGGLTRLRISAGSGVQRPNPRSKWGRPE